MKKFTNVQKENPVLESGLQNITKLAQKYKKCVIYYHQDMDGVASAISIREYLKSYGIQIVGCEWTQYGPRTFANDIKPWADDTMMVLVDFAQGSSYFTIATDHHDRQTDFDKSPATHARHSPSNVETLDRIVAKNPAFPQDDLDAISMIDSAGYLKHNQNPEQVTQSTLSELEAGKTPGGLTKNKVMLANVVNRLLLAYKNKPNGNDKSTKGYLLNKLVMECAPSLVAMYQMIKKTAEEQGWDSGEEIAKHHANYVAKQKVSKDVKYDAERGIIVQYGGGYMVKTGSYNRYTPFKNFPDSIFLSIAWPMGLLQVSCNPFKKKMFPDIDLGQIMREILDSQKDRLSNVWTNLETIKKVSESELNENVDAIGYKWDSISSGYLTSFSEDQDVKIDDNKIKLYIKAGKDNKSKSVSFSESFDNIRKSTIRETLNQLGVKDEDITLSNVECSLTRDDKSFPVKLYKDWALDQNIGKLVEFATKNLDKINLSKYNFTIKTKNPSDLGEYQLVSKDNQEVLDRISKISNKYHKELSDEEKKELATISVNVYDLIKKSSGGHKAITNMSGFQNLVGCNKQIEKAFSDLFTKYNIKPNADKSIGYVELLKLMQVLFVERLSKMIDNEKLSGKKYDDSNPDLIPDLTSTLEKIQKFTEYVKKK
jgi:hypothetical protein